MTAYQCDPPSCEMGNLLPLGFLTCEAEWRFYLSMPQCLFTLLGQSVGWGGKIILQLLSAQFDGFHLELRGSMLIALAWQNKVYLYFWLCNFERVTQRLWNVSNFGVQTKHTLASLFNYKLFFFFSFPAGLPGA